MFNSEFRNMSKFLYLSSTLSERTLSEKHNHENACLRPLKMLWPLQSFSHAFVVVVVVASDDVECHHTGLY